MTKENLLFARFEEKFLERLPELDVEDGVDNGIEKAVHVSQPDKEREQDGIDVTHLMIVAYAYSVDDVDRKERYPTEEKHT